MSLAEQIQMAFRAPSTGVRLTLSLATGEKIDIMKDGRVFAWTTEEPREIKGHYSQKYGACSIYRNLDDFNEKKHYYNGDVKVSDHSIEGQGEMFWPNGDHYVGEFGCCYLDGQGAYTCADGRRYVGRFECDRMEGRGTFSWPDGSSYEGTFFEGNIERNSELPGKFTFADGEIFIGNPFGRLQKSVILGSPKYRLLLQQAEPKETEKHMLRPGPVHENAEELMAQCYFAEEKERRVQRTKMSLAELCHDHDDDDE